MSRFKRYLVISSLITIGFCVINYNHFDIGYLPVCIFLGFMIGLLSLGFDTKKEKQEKKRQREAKRKAEQQRKESMEAEKNAPGCYNKDGVDLLTFHSSNNLFTAGNNDIRYKIRNRNQYDVIVLVRYKYSNGWENSVHSVEIRGNQIKTVETLGRAWRKAIDISIVDVR